jgi:3-deoxy-7-phosphoheptulonate synthase
MSSWTPEAWQHKIYRQSISYDDPQALTNMLQQLRSKKPLVSVGSIKNLRQALIAAEQNKAFIFVGGDCAERFSDANPISVKQRVQLLQSIGQRLQASLEKPIIKIGRMAGQYAKPRTDNYDASGSDKLLSYRGDLINRKELNTTARQPRPEYLLEAYDCAESTLSLISKSASQSSIYTSHEALHLPYEASLTRQEQGDWYCTSAHLPWLGMRTNFLGSAHIEYLRGIANPISIKLGSSCSSEWLEELLQTLNPHNEQGRICLTPRLGVDEVERVLPPLIETVRRHHYPVVWQCDPMHGNTSINTDGKKVRLFDDILQELNLHRQVHRELGSHLAGLHLEISATDVNEVVGGPAYPEHIANILQYESMLDPRLNPLQCDALLDTFDDEREKNATELRALATSN